MGIQLKTFRMGGIHPSAEKITAGRAIEEFALPEMVTIPLGQHIGAPAKPLVAKGDKVVVGQRIAESGGFVSANIHSSVSGTVQKIDSIVDASGFAKPAVFIKVEGDEWDASIDRSDTIVRENSMSAKEILDRIVEMGIVGMGGATFPTHVKLSVPAGKKVEYLLLNGVECEPYLTADHRLMLERGEQILIGASLLRRALGNPRTIIAIENNKPDAIEHLTKLAATFEGIEVQPLKVKYPQGGEKQLIAAVTGREVPAGKLPLDVGAVVDNVGTVYAIYEALQKHKPLFERVVTVTGKELPNPGNFMVRIGTPIQALLEATGWDRDKAGKVISGGPMMGRALKNLGAPVAKGSSGILVMPLAESNRRESSNCIRCSKCSQHCPMGLEPYLLVRLAKLNDLERLEHEEVMSCIECGSCSFTCPANIPLLDLIRMGKSATGAAIRARARK